MIELAKVLVSGVDTRVLELEPIPEKITGATVRFVYDDPMWDGLIKNAVFVGTEIVSVLNIGEEVEIPPEAVAKHGKLLKVGVCGTTADGKTIIPTLYANLGQIRPAADPSADPSADPTLPVWAQLQAEIEQLKQSGTGGNEVLCVTVQDNTADKTVTEIYEAYRAGKAVVCYVHDMDGNFATNLVVCTSDMAVFSASVGDVVITVMLTENGVQVEYVDILTENDLPDDIGGGISVTGAKVGQTVRISAVDENGSPTAWEPADFPDSGGNVDYVGVEPAYDDIPKVFFGGALQQTKDEKVVPFRYISKSDDFSGYAEIKAQGNSSMNYPKKNQTVKMFADEACDSKLKKDFKGWGKQNKHVYKANWIDLSHARNIVSARLWADVVKSRANYEELPELLRTTPNQGAVDGFPVKVYAAGVYQGRYTLNIPKDKWTFNMDDDLNEHCVLCGENYASGCFRAPAQINESDWTDEIHDVVPASIKTRWNEVISFVMNSTDEEFRANLSQYFYVDSLIDYYLFALASCGLDALGKNQIYMTYDGQRWIASMYDMDSTWGLYWNGSSFVATDYPRTSYEDWKNAGGNLLYIRLEQLFWSELQTRWAELKNGALSIENIINRFERFTDIAPAELVAEDYASTTGGGKFTGIPSKTTNNIQQIRSFALARQAWTDEYVEGLTPDIPVPCEGITLDKNTLTFTGEGTQTITATVIPDGCTDSVVWVSSNPSVATISVDGAVCTVAAVANGSTTITVTCGEHSASCSVAVSGFSEAVPCTGITLNKTALNFTEAESQTIVATVTPADTTDKVVWSSDNTAVATVANGVVTAVGDGSAIITATCGSKSASCAVSVALPASQILYYGTDIALTNNIKTGVKLLENDIDFTIIYDATLEPTATYLNRAFVCQYFTALDMWSTESSKWNVLYMEGGTNGVAEIPQSANDRYKIAAVHKAGSDLLTVYVRHFDSDAETSEIYTITATGTYKANSNEVFLQTGTQQTVVDEFGIYSYAMTEGEIRAWLMGVEYTPCTGISLDKSTLTFTERATQTLTATVSPDETGDPVLWASDNTNVAEVEDGVITALANGSAVITATCGEYSASCTVTVQKTETTKYLYQDFSPNGEAFSTEALCAVDLGDSIEAKINLSGCTGNNENILSVGGNITDYNATAESPVYHFYYTRSNGNIICYLNAGVSTPPINMTISGDDLIIVINKNGCSVNGEMLAYSADKVASFNKQRTLRIGSLEGKTRSKATYEYIKVVRV